MKKIYLYTLATISLSGLLVACASNPLMPGAENVKLTTHPVAKSCQMRGAVRSQDISGVSIAHTSHENLQIMQLNALRNDALKLGANVVMLTGHATGSGPEYYSVGQNKFTTNPSEMSHGMQGNAYLCSSDTYEKINNTNFSAISDVRR